MEQALLVGRQVLLIFLYITLGIVGSRTRIFDEKAGRSLSNFCLSVVTPCVMISNFMRPFDPGEAKGLALAFGLAALFHVFAALAAIPLIRKRPGEEFRVERLGIIFSNCGYMALPLIRVACGETGVFYALGFISVFNIALWSLGVMIITGQKRLEARKMFLNPGVIAFVTGLFFYLTQLKAPVIIVEALEGVAAFNTPLSMITTGIFLAALPVRETFANPRVYKTAFCRLLVLPLIMLAFMKLIGVGGWMPGAQDIVLTVGLGCACPCAAAVTMLPARFGKDGDYGARLVAASTLLSVFTLPLMTLLIRVWFP